MKEYPLSDIQRGILFHVLENPSDVGMYITQVVARFCEEIHEKLFWQAWEAVIQRHEALRSCLRDARTDHPAILVYESVSLIPSVYDFSASDDAENQFQNIIAEDLTTPFDLKQGSLMRFALCKLSEKEYRLLWSHHHLLLDASSFALVLQEVLTFYDASLRGEAVQLPVSRSFTSVHDTARSYDEEAALTYWKNVFKDVVMPSSLSSQVKSSFGSKEAGSSSYEFDVDPALFDNIQHITQQHMWTLNTFIQAAWGLLLAYYLGSETAVYGAVRSYPHASRENSVGLFINTLPMLVRCDPKLSIVEYLQEVRKQHQVIRKYVYTPIGKIREQMESTVAVSLFDTVVNFKQRPVGDAVKSATSPSKRSAQYSVRTNYPLLLEMYVEDGLLKGKLDYHGAVFPKDFIHCLVKHYLFVLEQMVQHINGKIGDVEIFPSQERQQMLIEWNETKRPYPREKSVAVLFAEQAAKTPNNIAAMAGGVTITYAELNRKANQLASHLRGRGIESETLVGICVHRGLEMLIGLLGILKAGGTYIPIDPHYPAVRIQQMLVNSGAQLLLTESALRHAMDIHCATLPQTIEMIQLDTDWPIISQEPSVNPVDSTKANHLAYIIYTSGSTGNPKGVMIQHHNLTNLVCAMQELFDVTEQDRLLAVTPMSFDMSGLEFYVPLSQGACCVIADRNTTMDGENLKKSIRRDKISMMQATPISWQLLLESGWKNTENIKVLCGGEAFKTALAKKLLSCSEHVWNLYGLTETTIWSMSYKLEELDEATPFVPIGRSIDNTQVYVLNKTLHLVPVGIPGELYIAGAGVASGYYKRAQLTQERFIPNPYSRDTSDEWLYKTGDLVRWLPDGNLEYIERLDNQAKIRGFRIELGEVEAALQKHKAVKEAVAVAQEDESGLTYLAAYLICAQDKPPSSKEFPEHLKALLPGYMIPSVFVKVEYFPLTPNGKIDRKALPNVSEVFLSDPEVRDQDITKDEAVLREIWSDVLKVPKQHINMDESFFSLGGHSLSALQIVNRIQRENGVTIDVHTLFEHPTICLLSEEIQSLKLQKHAELMKDMQAVKNRPYIPLSFSQQMFWFMMQMETAEPFYNLLLTMNFDGALDYLALTKALLTLLERHDQLRVQFLEHGGKPYQKIVPIEQIHFDLNVEDARSFDQQAIKNIMYQESHTPFDLTADQLIRFRLFKLDHDKHILLACVQHIIMDGWSFNIFVSELSILYNTFLHGKPNPLPPRQTRYIDFVFWQIKQLEAKKMEPQVIYWKKQLEALPVFELQTDYQRPAVQTHAGQEINFNIPAEIYGGLKKLSKRTSSTMFAILLSAFDVLLAQYTGLDDIVVGSPFAGRYHKSVEEVIGCFINPLVFRSDVSGNPTFVDFLNRNKNVISAAFARKNIPFERIVEILQPTRDQSRNPLFQIMLVVQHEEDEATDFEGLETTYDVSAYEYSRFDLTLFVYFGKCKARIVAEFNTALFKNATIERFVNHFQILLSHVIDTPSKPIMALDYLSDQERQQMLIEWNEAKRPYPRNKSVAVLFSEQAAKTPSNIAAMVEGVTITYAELNRKTNQLASHLKGRGIESETLVGICVHRGLEMLIGLLGILKAGGTYIPIDPHYPAVRIQQMLVNSGAQLLLTESALRSVMNAHFAKLPQTIEMIQLDTDWPIISQEPSVNPVDSTKANHLAYMIYTSGSTGKPKGVMIQHHNLTNLVCAMQELFDVTEQDRLLAVTPMSFDISGLEFYVPLSKGACCVIADRNTTMDGEKLRAAIKRYNISIMQATPITWQLLLESGWKNKENIKVLCGGEAFKTVLAKKLLSCSEQVWNLYGPTETTIWSTSYKLEELDETKPFVAIGRPIANTPVYVLNNSLHLVPVGIPGELYIAGAGVARGYYKRAQLTQERFIPNPYSCDTSDEWLYKTGDLVRWLPDGNLEYIERLDNQAKIHGFRIELGEVEVALQKHQAVKEVVAVVQEDESGHKYLAAYLICEQDNPPSSKEFREHLKTLLPGYMIPRVIVKVEYFPLTPNGKIDRKALPKVSGVFLSELEVQDQDITKDEAVLREIWSDVLKVPKQYINLDDDFFDLGGFSLSALQVISRIRQQFAKDISVSNIFDYPSIRQLAKRIKGLHDSSQEHIYLVATPSGKEIQLPIIQLAAGGSKTPLFLIHPVGGTIFWYKTLAKYLQTDRSVYAIQDPSVEMDDILFQTIDEMASAYKSVITRIQPQGPYILGGSSFGANVSFEISRQMDAEGVDPNYVLLLDGWAFYPQNFAEAMRKQHKAMRKQFAGMGIEQSDMLLNLQLLRMQVLIEYQVVIGDDQLILFKSEELLPRFKDMEARLNYWDQYAKKPVELYMVSGNHETMFQEPHVQVLAEKMGMCLAKIEI